MHRLASARRPLRGASITPLLLSLAIAPLLGACGGNARIESTPLPPPVPPSPPPPPPAAEVTPFPPPTGPASFPAEEASASAQVAVAVTAGGSVDVTGIDRLNGVSAPNLGIISLTYRGPNSYFIEFNGFGGADLVPSEYRGSTSAFDSYSGTADGLADRLELARAGQGVALSYLTFGNVIQSVAIGANTGESTITFFAAGSRTPDAQLPRTGKASYGGLADGLWVDGRTVYRLYGSQATLIADFAAGQLTSTLDLVGRVDAFGAFLSSPSVSLGRFTGSGSFGTNRFTGTYSSNDSGSGSFSGSFYGPAAEEYGLAFKVGGPAGQTGFGTAVGRRD